jgi:hypothetical protein
MKYSKKMMGRTLVYAEFGMELALMIATELMEEMKRLRPDFEKWLPEFEEHITTCFSVRRDPGVNTEDMERWGKQQIAEFLKRIREDLGSS